MFTATRSIKTKIIKSMIKKSEQSLEIWSNYLKCESPIALTDVVRLILKFDFRN